MGDNNSGGAGIKSGGIAGMAAENHRKYRWPGISA